MRHADLRLVPAATVVWALAVLGITVGTAAAIAAAAVIISLVLSVIMVLGGTRRSRALFAHLGILVLAGTLLVPALQRAGATTDALEEAARHGLRVDLAVTASADPAPPGNGPQWARTGQQVMADVAGGTAAIGREQVRIPGAVPLLLRAEGEAASQLAAVRDGDTMDVRGMLRSSGDLLVLTATEVRLRTGSGATAAMQSARQGLREQARAAMTHLPADEAALVRGMTSGDTSGMGERTEEMMRRAGITHLVAVSGANIALVLAAVLGPLLLMGVRRRLRLVLAAIAVAGYVWLVGDEPSVQRAATMVAPLLAARFAGVRASPVAALALTVALWSVLDPVTAASVGFLLSALATAAILIAAPPLAGVITDLSGERIGRGLALVLAVPLVAQLACTPILILLVPELSIWAVAVNLLVGPIVAPTTVIGLIALLVGTVWPAAAEGLNTVAAGGAHLVLLIARTADALPGSRIAVPAGATGVLVALGAILALTIALAARRSPVVHWIVAALVVVAIAPGVGRLSPMPTGPAWIVAACAVGQGDAVLLRPDPSAPGADGTTRSGPGTGDRPTVLIDTGPDPAALRQCLDRLDVQRIDLLILSHPHGDHVGGNAALTGARTPDQQWICPLPEAADHTAGGAEPRAVTTGAHWERAGLDLEVLWPPTAGAARSAAAQEENNSGEGDAANDCSLALSATWGDGTRMVTLGDLEPAAQRELAALSPPASDIVKVAHHGSRFQHAGLYRALDADLALITVGADNSFGHPTDEVLDLLAATGTSIVRTDADGTVILPADDPAAPRSVGPAR